MVKPRDLESLTQAPKPSPKPSRPGNRPNSMFEQRASQKPAPRWKPGASNPNAPPTAAAPSGSAAGGGGGSEGAESKDTGKDVKSPLPIIGLPTIPDDQPNEVVTENTLCESRGVFHKAVRKVTHDFTNDLYMKFQIGCPKFF